MATTYTPWLIDAMKRSGTYDENMQKLAAQDPWNPQSNAAGYGAQADYAKQIQNYQNALLQAQQQAKQAALRTAYENNSQALNSQKSSVNNAYTSAVNSINATKEAQLPQYQSQRNAASADAAQTARKVRELMAATGRFNSGMNRSQQLAVELNRQNAIQGANQAENQFTTQISNQLSDVENQKASSLSDVAEKLALLQRQYNQGTLDLSNQMASEKAAGAAQAMIQAQNWADQQRQRGIDNSFRQGQFDHQKQVDSWNQSFQQQKYDGDQTLQLAQLLGSYNGTPTLAGQQLQLQREQMNADNAYRNRALDRQSSNRPSLSEIKYIDEQNSKASTNEAFSMLQQLASSGKTRSEILNTIKANWSRLANDGVDVNNLYNTADKMYRWDKRSSGEWYDIDAKV